MEDTNESLNALVGKEVRVAITKDGFSRNHYGAQIAVAGVLERHPEGDAYRVVMDDDNFAYFEPEDVVLVNMLASVPTIMLTIPVETNVEATK